ncbi:hypothetical protein CDAR_115271 [Caerostris darwini]|uniref:Uncharacterized protein n=1 Tax=Caerostris darwini TaxID=1538125 RepID=A0AAV4U9W3_9ARAC|nr:hypothetical protein CDAR_115271 [Caerostris darwini]
MFRINDSSIAIAENIPPLKTFAQALTSPAQNSAKSSTDCCLILSFGSRTSDDIKEIIKADINPRVHKIAFKGETFLIKADLNAHGLWDYRNEDNRGKQVTDLEQYAIFLLNKRNAEATFYHTKKAGWPDLTTVSDLEFAKQFE